MRIAYLINQYPKVSHTFIRREIQALERAGVEVLRISLRGWNEPLVDPEDIAERKKTRYVLRAGGAALAVALIRVAFSRPNQFFRALSLTFRMSWRAERPLPIHLVYLAEACLIWRWLQLDKADHVHAHFGTNSAEVAMLVHQLGCPTWSFTVHGPEEFDKPHFIGLPEKIRRANFVVAVSSYGRSQIYRLVSHDIWPKIHVVRCGLDKRFLEALPSRSERLNPPRFACVGRLCEQKGQLLLLQAASRLKSKGVNFELMLVGDGEMRGELENIISNENLGDRVRITGWLDNQRVREVILASTALVLPSFAEGLPIVIMEAMALERPVISTYIAGIPELVTNDENGWLVPAGDLERLVDAMETCANASDTVLDTFGHTSRQRVVQAHDIDTEAQKLQGLFSGQCSRISQD